MKKVLLVAALAVFGLSANAQTSFGVTAGVSNFSASGDGSGSEFGFYVGALADIGVSDAFHVQPGVSYSMNGDASSLLVPIMAKYYVGDSGFNIQAGPQLNLLMGDIADGWDAFLGDDFSALGIQIAAGAGYDINENIAVEARYGFQVNNHYSGDGDFDLKYNMLTVGAVYKF